MIDENADSGKYVVFDFDNTSVIFDVEEALLIYQIENLAFKIDPDDMADVLETQIPDLTAPVGTTVDGEDVSVEELVADLTSDYAWLYENYEGFGAGGAYGLEYIHATNRTSPPSCATCTPPWATPSTPPCPIPGSPISSPA